MLRQTFLAVTLITSTALAQKADPFAEGVRTTEPLEPAEQRAKFKLPPGFEIQLVAAEPDLRKPMNMAFDATGRLWVSESREYPFPAKEGAELRDSIRIFSDFGPDGRARKMEVFADKLNIPIGLYPFRTADGHWKCVAWSIPNIWLFEDTDGDGKADKREVLFGPLGWERDTHGNQASFRRGDDGWIYATHGFNNHSVITAKDGSSVTLDSGNVYRFRLDGSRVEQWTHGQVNPFGLCWDDYGNLFSADCHSSPIYQLLRGGYYPSFGKPHDGLGFAPQTIQHSHGSTAICGPMLIRDKSWPAELQGHMLIGNVMTSRLNHDLIEWHGSSSKGKELPDFLTSEDPWFRPVDLQWGPDGALYIADFYNRIIGHYEVPLTHPGRDRERGRIWRVVYKGDSVKRTANASVEPADCARYGDLAAQRELEAQNGRMVVKKAAPAVNIAATEEPSAKLATSADKTNLHIEEPSNAKTSVSAQNNSHFREHGKTLLNKVKPSSHFIVSVSSRVAQNLSNGLQDASSALQNASTVVQNASAVVQNASAVVRNASAFVQNASTVAQNASTVAQDASTVAQDASTVAQDASTVAQDASTVAQDASTVVQDASTIPQNVSTVLQDVVLPADFADSDAPFGASNCDVTEKSAQSAQSADEKPASKIESISVAPDASLPKEEQIAALVKELGSPNPTRRSLALNELCDRFGAERLGLGIPGLSKPLPAPNAFARVGNMNLGARSSILSSDLMEPISDADPLVRVHALRLAGEELATTRRKEDEYFRARAKGGTDYPPGFERGIKRVAELLPNLQAALADKDPMVRRVAAETLAVYPNPITVAPLLKLLRTTDKADDHLIYSTRVALREHLRDAEVVKSLKLDAFSKEDLAAILDIMPAVPGEHAALLRLELFEKLGVDSAELAKHLPGIIKNAPAERLNGIAALAQKKLPGDAAALSAILTALDERGVPPGDVLAQWAGELVPVLLSQKAGGWENRADPSDLTDRSDQSQNPWALQDRKSSDGQTTPVMSSFPKGEKRTGVLRSAAFAAPEKLRFYLCGHDGTPPGAPGKKNFVRLIDADGKTLREAAPPRNDTAQRIEWDLADVRGKMVRFEATDGDSGEAYAWLAFGRFKPELPELALGGASSQKALAAELAGRFKLVQHRDAIAALLNDRKADVDSRAAAAKTLVAFRTEKNAADNFTALSAVLKSADEPDALREKIAVALGSVKSPSICGMVADAMPSASAKLQQSFATALSANRCGTVVLIAAIENGKASPHVLRDKATVDRLKASAKAPESEKLQALIAKLPPANVEADKLIAARRAGFKGGDIARGATVFQTNCAVCHQIGKVGNLVGPQLDGVGGRGLDRIIEDILDPNRNVDRAFRLSIVTLKDGGVASGLLRREEGGQMVLADIQGKESSIPQSNVAKREEADTSLMPPAFGQTIAPADFNDLLAYLLSQRPNK